MYFPFTQDEIAEAVTCSNGNTSLGPDSFSISFIKIFWVFMEVECSFLAMFL